MANSVAATFSDEIPNMNNNNNFIFPFSSNTSIFDIMPPAPSSCDQKVSSYSSSFGAGFMDLLAVHDYNPFSFDCVATTTTTTTTQIENYHHRLTSPADGSEVLNTPASPNSTSISLKPKKKNQKKQREPRFAFMTQSDVDQLDDGYRWRKYGQKAVKNSPYPRSYYRCTTAGCSVKKRVERSSDDPSIVVTTYEGQHTHPCPATSRASLGFMHYGNSANTGVLGSHHHFVLPHHQQQFHQALSYDSTTPPLNPTSEFVNPSSFSALFQDQENHHNQGFVPSRTTFLKDNGLLQDIVPTQMMKEMKEEDE
ncbi:unnamed protein product [Lupinus luteus]|uniref:WRKY domain-containing protein n=1 Tax=Lupinus luteus TaxID=3873 RepID=A0AAV1WCN7_LUPLU